MVCRRCGEDKQETEFARVTNRRPNGHDKVCKACRNFLHKLRQLQQWDAWDNRKATR
jgi:hypothetical protein